MLYTSVASAAAGDAIAVLLFCVFDESILTSAKVGETFVLGPIRTFVSEPLFNCSRLAMFSVQCLWVLRKQASKHASKQASKQASDRHQRIWHSSR